MGVSWLRIKATICRKFFSILSANHTAVTVFLVNGVKLQGIITWFDNFCLLLKRDHTSSSFQHAISTIMPSIPVNLEVDEKISDEG